MKSQNEQIQAVSPVKRWSSWPNAMRLPVREATFQLYTWPTANHPFPPWRKSLSRKVYLISLKVVNRLRVTVAGRNPQEEARRGKRGGVSCLEWKTSRSEAPATPPSALDYPFWAHKLGENSAENQKPKPTIILKRWRTGYKLFTQISPTRHPYT